MEFCIAFLGFLDAFHDLAAYVKGMGHLGSCSYSLHGCIDFSLLECLLFHSTNKNLHFCYECCKPHAIVIYPLSKCFVHKSP